MCLGLMVWIFICLIYEVPFSLIVVVVVLLVILDFLFFPLFLLAMFFLFRFYYFSNRVSSIFPFKKMVY